MTAMPADKLASEFYQRTRTEAPDKWSQDYVPMPDRVRTGHLAEPVHIRRKRAHVFVARRLCRGGLVRLAADRRSRHRAVRVHRIHRERPAQRADPRHE